MVFRGVLGSLLMTHANAAHWALLAAGSNTYNNYRHQSDLCHAYQILVSKGFSKDRIITMAYDDIANHEENPFPGQIFNTPSPDAPGVDVYHGCNLDYTGADVTAANFQNLLLGTSNITGGNGRTLDTGPDDHLTVLYFDHGAPGLIQFPAGDAMHAIELQAILKSMHATNRYGKMVIYIEACNSGSMLEDIPTDINVYGVTAVPADYPSLGTYCGYDAVINGTSIGSCLGDLFAVFYMKFINEGNGTHTLNQFFQSVFDDVASYAALHYGRELNQQFGDLSIGDMLVSDFFYGDSESDIKLASPFPTPWVAPKAVYAAPRLHMDATQFEYTEASARPTFHGEQHWIRMLRATDNLQGLLHQQKQTQELYWDLVMIAAPDSYDQRYSIWTSTSQPKNPKCELQVHLALFENCPAKGWLVASSYALQFHQVVVNLCSDSDLGWGNHTERGVQAATEACHRQPGRDGVLV